MELRLVLVSLLIICLISGESEAKRSSSGGSRRGSGGYGSKPRTTQRPPASQNSGGSQPVGWNTNNKPSAPEHTASKATAVHTQSGNPYGQQHGSNPYYPAGGTHQTGYNNPSGGYHPQGGYNPSSGGYHPQGGYNQGGGYHPQGGYNNPSHYPQNHGQSHGLPYQPYQPPQGGYSSPGHGYNPSVGTPVIVQGSSKPGIGQIAKEAFVYAGVSAGVNAAVNRIIPGGIYGHSGGSSSQVSPSGVVPTNTQITYNNYYNGSAPGAAPADNSNPNSPQPAVPIAAQAPATNSNAPAANNNPPPAADAPASNQNSNPQNSGVNNPPLQDFPIAAHDIQQVTEDLFKKDTNNANHHITVNLQGQKKDDSTNDDAPEHLLTVKSEAYEIPTVKAVLALHDNYELSVKTKENVTPEERNEESTLLDEFLKTDLMQAAMKFLADKGYIPKDEYEYKDILRAIWFTQFKRIEGDSSSSGFETVFLAEQFDNEIIGLHNWIYFAKQEEANNLNYLGYIQEKKLASTASVIKLRSTLNNVLQPVTSIFVGTSPELEMALYTICFYTRPNNLCPVSLGGSQFSIIVNRVNYFGKEILVSAYPEI
ncbi:poly(U)-specific endoribonuclease homolog isoform X2 [Leptopilina heterotoma]|uniref:poly(U)-specific endoribonuclease homolog isoform X2 n=1 Tax=Leptopilina heterotoma TaxID=63436 RepID=UPI001CA7DBB4|nr:poly(U)-specific endoribonuclease homolog isoform X2 [Leptopilina heterotoma]